MLECVVNLSEGRDRTLLAAIVAPAGDALLDLHADPHHHRAVATLVGEDAVRAVTLEAVARLDLRTHTGVHPRFGVVDVVPFVPLGRTSMDDAVRARDRFARWAATTLDLPCFCYGPPTGRTLPEIRRRAFTDLPPDVGPPAPHPTAGACAVGARGLLVAYNVVLAEPDLAQAKRIAQEIRGPHLRALGLPVGDAVQVSMNLIAPEVLGPAQAFDLVAAEAPVARAELVGLVPRAVLDAVPPARWAELDLGPERTIESRLERAGIVP